MTIVGTRPEIIRLSRVIPLLDKHTNHILVHTGQNYDYELNEIFFEELELRKPDHFLNVDTSSLGAAVGDIIRKSEEVLIKEQPDALLVLGDTNSCLSAYMAKRMHIPIFHMEAGNRCFDQNVPEETNRKIIDHIADFNLVYTEHARRHLLSEGLPHRRIYLTGSPMKEVLDYYKLKIQNSNIINSLSRQIQENNPRESVKSVSSVFYPLEPQKYFVVSTHREENVDNPKYLKQILEVLNKLAEQYKVPIIFSTHPRTRKRLEEIKTENNLRESVESVSSVFHLNPLIQFLKPFGFPDFVHLQMHALCTLSDSGTISEESSILSFPAISIRQSMERPEAQDAGTIILSGFDPNIVLSSVQSVIEEHRERNYKSIAPDYTITNTSWRVLKLILGNTKLSNKWWGINNGIVN